MADRAYVLGTHDEEIDRLGLQHRVWRPRMTACWQRTQFGPGQKIIDVGAGPGFATIDLAQIVGQSGRVAALELSERFANYGRAVIESNDVDNVDYRNLDLVNDELEVQGFDAAWCRWVMSFVSDPALVVRKVSACLRPGGRFALHEYLDYSTWSCLPPRPAQAAFRDLTMRNWRGAGGEPNIGFPLVGYLKDAGFKIVHAEPILFTIRPTDYAWQWPKAWIESSSKRLVETGEMTAAEAASLFDEFADMERDPGSLMLSPSVIELIAEKL